MDSMERIMELAKKKAQAPAQRRQSKDKIHSYGKAPLQVGQRHNTNNGLHDRKAQTNFEVHSRDHDYAR